LNRVPLTPVDHGEEWALPGDIRRLTMRELSTNELDTVIGGSVSYPGVYLQELSGNVTSIPGVSTSTGQQLYVAYQNNPFHHKVL
jgi:bacteriocin-like protein